MSSLMPINIKPSGRAEIWNEVSDKAMSHYLALGKSEITR
ncbi:hypothetical protein SAMN05661093_11087 [Kibdelosporangium aridum]|uniref:Uncharacterized protein n=1 Tax=Kibdelosporangium aridum TaxID=2030 RepID=A0A1Y5YCA2_KIBAR|nr:hypothetical protein SAMN05661093_11087 [Kibdelosporangium aridum]